MSRTFGHAGVVSLAFSVAVPVLVSCLGPAGGGVRAQEGEDPPPDRSAKDLLPPLAEEKLPARTRPAPDPAKDRLVRDPVFVWVEEAATSEAGKEYVPDLPVTQNYLKAYLQRAGHPVVDDPAKSKLRVEGSVKLRFHSRLRALDRPVGWKYRVEASFRVLDAGGTERDRFEVPELLQENVRSEESTVLNARRHLAKVVWDRLFHHGSALGDAKIEALINCLALEGSGSEGDAGQPKEPETAEDVVTALADRGLEVVPHLLDAMLDDRRVAKKSSYPGLDELSAADLRVYHVADKALEEIFQKVSRLSLDTERTMSPLEKQRARTTVVRGWEQEWKRFCPSFAAYCDAQSVLRGGAAGAAPRD